MITHDTIGFYIDELDSFIKQYERAMGGGYASRALLGLTAYRLQEAIGTLRRLGDSVRSREIFGDTGIVEIATERKGAEAMLQDVLDGWGNEGQWDYRISLEDVWFFILDKELELNQN
jgi:hypothetical protein